MFLIKEFIMKKIIFILGVSILLPLFFSGCAEIEGMDLNKFPQPYMNFADGWVKVEYMDGSWSWVGTPLPPGRNWGQVTELPAMTIKKGAAYRISFDSSFITGKFSDRYTVAMRGSAEEDAADIIYEEEPVITWVNWTINYKDKILTAAELVETLPIDFLANEFLLGLRAELRREIANTSPPFLSAAIAPDLIAGNNRPAVINSNDAFNVFSKVPCTMTYIVRFTYNYQYREDDRLRIMEKTEDKKFTFHVIP